MSISLEKAISEGINERHHWHIQKHIYGQFQQTPWHGSFQKQQPRQRGSTNRLSTVPQVAADEESRASRPIDHRWTPVGPRAPSFAFVQICRLVLTKTFVVHQKKKPPLSTIRAPPPHHAHASRFVLLVMKPRLQQTTRHLRSQCATLQNLFSTNNT